MQHFLVLLLWSFVSQYMAIRVGPHMYAHGVIYARATRTIVNIYDGKTVGKID